MSILNRIQLRSNKPRITFEELEERIVLDASLEMMAYDPIFADAEPDAPQESIEDWGQITSSPTDSPILASAQDSGHSPELDVVLVSDSVDDLDSLVAAISDEAQIVIYNSAQDNVQTINQALDEVAELSDAKISRLGIMGHGAAGEFTLGTDTIDMNNVESFQGAFKELGANLTEDAQIHLYGCSVASSPEGKTLVNQLASYTTADVFASDDNTGGETRDWQLEFASDSSIIMSSMLKPDLIASVNTELADPVVNVGDEDPIWANPQAYPDLFSITETDDDNPITADLTTNVAAGVSGYYTLTAAAGVTVTPIADGFRFEGDLVDINSTLATLETDIDSGSEGLVTLNLDVTDNAGESDSDSATLYAHTNGVPAFTGPAFPIAVGPVNELGTINVGAGLGMEDTSDPDGAAGPLTAETGSGSYSATVSAAATNGTLTVSPAVPGVSGSGTANLSYTGPAVTIGSVLNGLEFTADSSGDDGVVEVSLDDNGSLGLGGSQTAGPGTINISVNAFNDPPEITSPTGPLTTPGNEPASFYLGGDTISINDPDAGDRPLEVTITATNGNFSLASTDGLTFSAGDGYLDTTMTFQGSQDAINNALDESFLSTSPTTADFFLGTSNLSIEVSDLGNFPGPAVNTTGPVTFDVEFVDPGGWGRWPRV